MLKNSFKASTEILLFMLALLVPLWYNGAPLYYPDSMGYLFWGMQMKVPPERAAVYGLFVRYASLGISLWLPVLLQSLLLAVSLRVLLVRVLNIQSLEYRIGCAIFLGFFSSVGWTSGMLMPDIFCACSSLLMGLLLLFGSRFSTGERILVICMFLFSSIQHVSIFLINLLILGGFSVYFLVTRNLRSHWFALFRLFGLVLISYMFIGLIHRQLDGEFFISKASNAFLIGRMAESGILANYLDEHCPSENLQLCDVRPSLPMRCEQFLWSKSSFLHHKGGLHDEKGAYKEVVSGVFSSPKYVLQFVIAGAKATAKQLFWIEVGDGLVAGPKPQLQFFRSDEADYATSSQSQQIHFQPVNFLIYAGLVFLLALFLGTKSFDDLSPQLKMLGLFLLIFFLANAAVNGALATPLNRYQTRVFWLADVWLLAALYPALRRYFRLDSQAPQ